MAEPLLETGVVAAFDDAAGLGRILGDDGDTVDFHCVSISDGSRHIAEGTPVTFARRLGPTGLLEAVRISSRPA